MQVIPPYSKYEQRQIDEGRSPRGRTWWTVDELIERLIRGYAETSESKTEICSDDVLLWLEKAEHPVSDSLRNDVAEHMRRAVDKGLLVTVSRGRSWMVPDDNMCTT
jgi:hypothetical protein